MSCAPLWEVFVRPRNGAAHRHVGSVRASDQTLAVRAACDLFTRRGEAVSLWVAPSSAITAAEPESLLGEELGAIYRNPDFYTVPDGVEQI